MEGGGCRDAVTAGVRSLVTDMPWQATMLQVDINPTERSGSNRLIQDPQLNQVAYQGANST